MAEPEPSVRHDIHCATVECITILRMEHVGIVVEDLAAAMLTTSIRDTLDQRPASAQNVSFRNALHCATA